MKAVEVFALLVPGRMPLPTILCCVGFIFVMSLILLGIWEALPCSEWSDAFLLCQLGDRALVLIFWSPRIHYVICHLLDKR
jgi:hypothetical protein